MHLKKRMKLFSYRVLYWFFVTMLYLRWMLESVFQGLPFEETLP